MTATRFHCEAPVIFFFTASVCLLRWRFKVVARLFRCRFSALLLVEHAGRVPEVTCMSGVVRQRTPVAVARKSRVCVTP